MASKPPPTVRMAKPKGRPIQLRYTCPNEGREIRISTGTTNEADALEQKQKLEAKLLLGLEARPRRRAKGGARCCGQTSANGTPISTFRRCGRSRQSTPKAGSTLPSES